MGEKPSLLKFFEDFGLMLLSIVLFLGGAFLLTLKIPFWSLFLGIASVQIGIVLIILTFDSLIKKRNKPLTDEYKTVNCLICRSSQYVPKYQKTVICDACMLRVATGLKAIMVVIFAFISISTVTRLALENQELRKKAQEIESDFECIEDRWIPAECACGKWEITETCEGGKVRLCRDEITYCCTKDENNGWMCYNDKVDK